MDLHLSRIGVAVAAAVALTASATGGAVADRLITSQDIANHTIQRQDLADGAVGPRILRDESVRMGKLSPKIRELLAGAGAAGPAGPAGPAGAAGPAGVSGYEIVARDVTGPSGTVAEANCPAGKSVLGGGAEPISAGANYAAPKPDGTGWRTQVGIAGPGTGTVRVYAICAKVTP